MGRIIFSMIISIGLIIGGLSGQLVLRGTNSSMALLVAGAGFLIYDIYRLIKFQNKKKINDGLNSGYTTSTTWNQSGTNQDWTTQNTASSWDQEKKNNDWTSQNVNSTWNQGQNQGYNDDYWKSGTNVASRTQTTFQEPPKKKSKAGLIAVIVLVIAVAAAGIFVLFQFSGSLGDKEGDAYKVAKDKAAQGYVVTALDDLLDYVEKDPDNIKAEMRLVEIAMQYHYYDYAAYTIDMYLWDAELSDLDYKKLNDYIDILDIYYNTVDLSDNISNAVWEEASGHGDTEDEQYEWYLNEYCAQLEQYIGRKDYDDSLLYYHLAYLTQDSDASMRWMQKCADANEYLFDAWAQLATSYRRDGDLAKARELLEHAYKINREDSSVLRSFATLEMVEGNLDKGLEYAESAYEFYPEGSYVADTYIVALWANGKKSEAQALKDELIAQSYLFEEDMEDLFADRITVYEYYVGE